MTVILSDSTQRTYYLIFIKITDSFTRYCITNRQAQTEVPNKTIVDKAGHGICSFEDEDFEKSVALQMVINFDKLKTAEKTDEIWKTMGSVLKITLENRMMPPIELLGVTVRYNF